MDKSKSYLNKPVNTPILVLSIITVLFISIISQDASASILSASTKNAQANADLLTLNNTSGIHLFWIDKNGKMFAASNADFHSSIVSYDSSGIVIRNPASTNAYTLTAGAIAANRTLNLPVTTGTDTLATLGLAQTFTGTITASGGITMSGSDITLAGNNIKTTNYNIKEDLTSGSTNSLTLFSSTTQRTHLALYASATQTGNRVGMSIYRTNDHMTNTEYLMIQSDVWATGELDLVSFKEGSGIFRPIDVYMGSTKEHSFDVANTETSYVPFNAQGLLTASGGITMSGSNINLGGNFIKTTTYTIGENADDGFNQGIIIQPTSGNTLAEFALASKGTSVTTSEILYRIYNPGTASERIRFGSDIVNANEYAIQITSAGTGVNRPFNIYEGSTKEHSFDVANTETSYVPLLLQNKITQYNNINTVGNGVPSIVGIDSRTGITAADGSRIVLYNVPATSGTVFRISSQIQCTTYTSGTINYNFYWTENGVVNQQTVTCASSNQFNSATVLAKPDASTQIQSQTTGTFTATGTVASTVEQLN